MTSLSPTTLTTAEQKLTLRVTAKHPRDHLIISLALGTGLRLGEIVGLNVGDVFNGNGRPRTRIQIRAEIAKGGKAGDVFLPDKLVAKLRRLRSFKKQRRESLDADAPLFCNQSRNRISKRRVQFAWREPEHRQRDRGRQIERHRQESAAFVKQDHIERESRKGGEGAEDANREKGAGLEPHLPAQGHDLDERTHCERPDYVDGQCAKRKSGAKPAQELDSDGVAQDSAHRATHGNEDKQLHDPALATSINAKYPTLRPAHVLA